VIIQCDRCYARYRYDETRFEGQPSKKVRCTKCLAVFEVSNPQLQSVAAPDTPGPAVDDTATRGGGAARTARTRLTTEERKKSLAELKLPSDAKLSLAVISGPASGNIFQIEKPKVIIGREDADVVLEDSELSRQHAAIEVAGDRVTIVDLGSTNGTFVDDEQITEANLENHGEFTVGGSTLMLIITKPS
jgi:predicted Zn finger-like uncharacterized protein